MLSRVADALFWMSRYLERAEHVARLLDVTFQLELDLGGLMTSHQGHWKAQLDLLQQPVPEELWAADDPSGAISSWFTFDTANPTSIVTCINRARNNARSIRGTISSEVWRSLNRLYWKLRDPDFVARARESPHDFYQAVEAGSHRFQGVCDATLPHDEGWQFIQLGKYLERADKTLRLVDVKYQQTRAYSGPVDLPLVNLEWAGVLKCSLAYEAYQRLYISRVEPERVIEFLLLNPVFPRAVRFCLEEMARALAAIEEEGGHGDGKVERLLGRMLSDLRYAELNQILLGDLHAFTTSLLQRCGQVTRALQERYALVH